MGRAVSGSAGSLNLSNALAGLAGRRILVACDFDGTISGIVARPTDARADPRALAALKSLADTSAVSVAVVSGRTRDELTQLLGNIRGVALIGEHGSDSGQDLGDESGLVSELSHYLREISSDYPGTIVEEKRLSVVFHYRQAGGGIEEGLSRVLEGPARLPGVTLTEGKKVLELHVTSRNKGDAVEELRASTGADAIVFFGDDVTDETVFARLQSPDVGVKVGDGESAAKYRVADVPGVADALENLSALFE